MKNKKIIILLLLIGFAASYEVKAQTNQYYKVKTKRGDSIIIKITKDQFANVLIQLVDTTFNYLHAVAGCGNCILHPINGGAIIKKYKLGKDTISETFIIKSSVLNSTFGAEYLFLIWNVSEKIWNIQRAPFVRFEIKDLNSDGIFEIIDYSNSKKGIIYSFEPLMGLVRNVHKK